MQAASHAPLAALYFDGRQGKGHAVTLRLHADALHIEGSGIARTLPCTDVQWPERTRHGMRIAHLEGGGSVQCADSAAWDAWAQAAGRRDSLAARLAQSWRAVAASVLLLVALVVALQQWGIPALARAVVALMPHSVDSAVGDSTLALLDAQILKPSTLPEHRAQQLRAALARTLATMPPSSVPPWQLVLRSSKLGPNALALPNGTIVLTDDMVALVGGDEAVLMGILAHELGHVRHRHGMRMLVQVAALGTLASAIVGDFSSLLAGVPVLLGQASYSRQAEQEADAMAVQVLRQARISPAVMVTLFEKLGQWRQSRTSGGTHAGAAVDRPAPDQPTGKADDDAPNWLGIAFSSHPADHERVRFFQAAAGLPTAPP